MRILSPGNVGYHARVMAPPFTFLRKDRPVAWMSLGLTPFVSTLFGFVGLAIAAGITRALQVSFHGKIGMLYAFSYVIAFGLFAALPTILLRRGQLAWLSRLPIP